MLVACAADEAFLAPASAMVHSLAAAVGDEPLDVVVMHDGALSNVGRDRVEASVGGANGTVRFVAIPPARLDGLPHGRFSPLIWARTLLPELLPEVDKVLYLDADTIVVDSPVPLWHTQLGDAYFAAVANPLYPFMDDWPGTVLGIEQPRHYVNSGVLLMSLDHMRRDGCQARLLDYARHHPDNPCPDQDALSAMFHDRHVSLHPRWNAQATLWDLRSQELPFTDAEVAEARADPAIVHFIGPFKPWHYLCTHPYRARYFEHLAATPWPRPPMEGRTVANAVLRRLSPAWVNRWFRARHALGAQAWFQRLSGGAPRRS